MGHVVIAALVAFIAGIGGTQAWKYYQKKQTQESETIFVALQKVALEANVSKDWKKLSDTATALGDKFPSTFYATDAQLMAAKAAFDGGDLAVATKHLQWVADKGRPTHQNIAKMRLAAVKMDEKKFDEALATLGSIKDEGYASQVAHLKGDVFAAQGRRDEARAAYEVAVDKAEQRSPLKEISKAKLDAFGGATQKPAEKKPDDVAAKK